MADVPMPQLGESVTEGTITKWFKQVGDQIAEDEVLFEVSTDKVDSEVPSPVAGYLAEIKAAEGDTVDVGEIIAVVTDEAPADGGAAPAEAPADEGEAPAAEAPAPAAPAPEPEPAPAAPAPAATPEPSGDGSGVVVSPVVRRLMTEAGIEASSVIGTGVGGRITRSDVEAVIEARGPEARRSAAATLFPEGGEPVVEGPTLVAAVFHCALWRWFGVLFWFVVAGAVGALGYRLVSLCAQGEARRSLPEAQRGVARTTLAVLNWPVAQLMTFALALAADFDKVLTAWRDWHANGVRLDLGFLDAAARASVASELAEEDAYAVDGPAQAPDLLELRDAMSLVWRILLLWLGLLALFVLAGWAT